MRIAEYKQIDTETVTNTIILEDGTEETIEKEVPIMGMVYRDATPEEEAEMQRMADEMPQPEPTLEEKVEDLSEALMIVTEMLIGGDL